MSAPATTASVTCEQSFTAGTGQRVRVRLGKSDAARQAEAHQVRRHRWQRLDAVRPVTTLDRLRDCGKKLCDTAGVTLGVQDLGDGARSAAFGGITSCGSVWCCPRCAAKIATRRAGELADVMRAVDEAGGTAWLITLTVRHSAGDRLGLTREERTQRDKEITARRRRIDELGALADAPSVGASGEAWQALVPDDGPGRVDQRSAAQREADLIEEEQLRAEIAALKASGGLWDHIGYGWGKATSGGAWTKETKRLGLIGWVRVVETTDGGNAAARAEGYSGNGWHTHVHALVAVREPLSEDSARAVFEGGLIARFVRAVQRRGLDVSGEHGFDVRRAQLGEGALNDYFVKLAHEATGSHRKEGKRQGGRTPMQLLADAVETYRADLIARWWEWEQVSQGRRQLEWSRGRHSLRAFAGLGAEQSDEEIAAEEQEADVRLCLPAETWAWITYTGSQCDLLDAAEIDGMAGARAWLDARDLEHSHAAGTGSSEVAVLAGRPGPQSRHQPYGWRHDARQLLGR